MDINEAAAAEASAFEHDWDPVYGPNGGYDQVRNAMEYSAKFSCGQCPRAPRLLTRRFEALFRGEHLPCPTCGRPIDMWHRFQNATSPEVIADLVGTRTTLVTVHELPDGPITIDLNDYGVPETANVVSISYSSMPSLTAINEWAHKHGILKSTRPMGLSMSNSATSRGVTSLQLSTLVRRILLEKSP